MTESTPYSPKYYPRSAFATDLEWVQYLQSACPVLGIRSLSIISFSDGHYKVCSPSMKCNWDGPLSKPAECYLGYEHQVPDLDCNCGYYIATDIRIVSPFLDGNGILCLVAGYGKVYEHEEGYRVEQAEVLATLSFGSFLSNALNSKEFYGLFLIGCVYYNRIWRFERLKEKSSFRYIDADYLTTNSLSSLINLNLIGHYSNLLARLWKIPVIPITPEIMALIEQKSQ